MNATVLVVDDEEGFRSNMIELLRDDGYEAIGASSLAEARQVISKESADIVLLDINLPDGQGPDLLRETLSMPGRPQFILITSEPHWEVAVMAMKNRAVDFLAKPVDFARLEGILKTAIETLSMQREIQIYRDTQLSELKNFYVGNSRAMKVAMDLAHRGAQSQAQILITGANGTGKGMLARAIHQLGPRSKKMFLHLNSASVPISVLESEMFGHEAGAFTDAKKRQRGKMELADEGILFLDEISAMPLEMQAKLLTAIEDHVFWRLGGETQLNSNVQVIAASNRNLQLMVQEGAFRTDLYYRLKVLEIHLPTLNDRKDDIPELAVRFIQFFNRQLGANIQGTTPQALEALMDYDWPGNIRELRNAIERAVILCDDPDIDLPHLPVEVTSNLVS
ncbi:MAG TPA: sigma-54 dependent transcriptional regulator [Anaerolineales bacterium]|nr:sigma-54 dependent transcriptional regulator [Anaerolineales bacterium]